MRRNDLSGLLNSYILAIITPALDIDHYAERLWGHLKSLNLSDVNYVKIIVGPERNRSLVPPEYIFIVEKNGTKGVFDAVHQGIEYAIKEHNITHFTFINCDDLLYPDFKFSIARSMLAPGAVVWGRVQWLSANGEPAGIIPYWPFKLFTRELFLAQKPPLTQQGVIVPISVYRINGGFNLEYKYISDTDLWYRLHVNGEVFICVRRLVAGYTMRPGQLSSQREKIEVEGAKWMDQNSLNSSTGAAKLIAIIIMNLWNFNTIIGRMVGQKKWRACSAVKVGGFEQ